MKAICVIPARYHSSRFPGKPLVKLCGKPLIIWVAEISKQAVGLENTYIATDDQRIADVVKQFDFKTVMTSTNALTGTDRIAEVAEKIDADIYLNIQGDEPLIHPKHILTVLEAKQKYPNHVINGMCEIQKADYPENVNYPKVASNEKGEMVYMSRSLIPGSKNTTPAQKFFRQVCIYGFNKEELIQFKSFGRKSCLESLEDIEILRFLELGIPVQMVEFREFSHAVDVPEDIKIVEEILRKHKK